MIAQAVCGYSEEMCRTVATQLGLTLGGAGLAFAGGYDTVGCYAYDSGAYAGRAYYGFSDNGGDVVSGSELAPLDLPRYRLPNTYNCEARACNVRPQGNLNSHIAVSIT